MAEGKTTFQFIWTWYRWSSSFRSRTPCPPSANPGDDQISPSPSRERNGSGSRRSSTRAATRSSRSRRAGPPPYAAGGRDRPGNFWRPTPPRTRHRVQGWQPTELRAEQPRAGQDPGGAAAGRRGPERSPPASVPTRFAGRWKAASKVTAPSWSPRTASGDPACRGFQRGDQAQRSELCPVCRSGSLSLARWATT